MSKTAAHFVWLNAGEKLFVITSDVAGETDYTQVVELVFPTIEDHGTLFIDPSKPSEQIARRAYEMNEVANMTSEYEHAGKYFPSRPVDEAIAHDVTRGKEEPFVSVPLSMVKKYFPREQAKKIIDDFSVFGLEEAKD